ANIIGQRLSLNIVHDHISDGVARLWWTRDLEVVNLDDIRMMQGSNHLCLTLETCDETGIVLQVGMENFKRDETMKLSVKGLPDLCHASTSQTFTQFIFPKILWYCIHSLPLPAVLL